jgi:hypothetical protein
VNLAHLLAARVGPKSKYHSRMIASAASRSASGLRRSLRRPTTTRYGDLTPDRSHPVDTSLRDQARRIRGPVRLQHPEHLTALSLSNPAAAWIVNRL